MTTIRLSGKTIVRLISYKGYTASWTDPSAGGPMYTTVTGGTPSEMSTSANTNDWTRQFNFSGNINYNRSFGKHDLYSQLKWEYEYRDSYGLNTTIYRQNVSWYTHYGFNKRYYVDLALLGSESSLLAPGHKWAFSPTISAAWVLSEENFLKNTSWIDLLKLRASFVLSMPIIFLKMEAIRFMTIGSDLFDFRYNVSF